jgi:hypothetical protein
MPNSDTCIRVIYDLVLWLQEWMPNKTVFERDWNTCSKYDNHFQLDSEDNLGDLYDHLMSTQIFTLIMNKIFISELQNFMRKVATTLTWSW